MLWASRTGPVFLWQKFSVQSALRWSFPFGLPIQNWRYLFDVFSAAAAGPNWMVASSTLHTRRLYAQTILADPNFCSHNFCNHIFDGTFPKTLLWSVRAIRLLWSHSIWMHPNRFYDADAVDIGDDVDADADAGDSIRCDHRIVVQCHRQSIDHPTNCPVRNWPNCPATLNAMHSTNFDWNRLVLDSVWQLPRNTCNY